MDRRQWGLTLTMAAASSVLGDWQSSVVGARLGGRQHQPNGSSRASKRRASGGDERDWPDFLGVHRDGCSSVTLQRRDWSKLPLMWRFNLGEGYALGSGRSELWIQTDRQGAEERTTCLRLDTGEMVWEERRPTAYNDLYGYDGGPRCSPVIADEHVYTYGVDGVLVARDITSGKGLWERQLNRDYHVVQNFFGVGSTPVVYQNLLWVMVGGSPPTDRQIPPGALDLVNAAGSAMVAVDRMTGETKFEVGQDLASYSSPRIVTLASAATDKSTRDKSAPDESTPNARLEIGLAFCREGLLGFDPATGKQHFHFPFRAKTLESVNAATPVVVGNQVLLSETYGVGSVLLELDPERLDRPTVVWQDEPRARDQSLQAHWNTPVFHDGFLYASSGRNTGNAELRCVEWSTGRVMWSEKGLTRCSLTKAADGDLIVVSEYGDLILARANPAKFEVVSIHKFSDPADKLRYPAWAGAALMGSKMLVRDKNTLFCFEIA